MGAMGPKIPHPDAQAADDGISKAQQASPTIVKKKPVKAERIIGTNDMIEGWQELPYIQRGYRLNYSYKDAFRSIFSWHNDTLNIWTHLMGIVYYLFMIPHVFSELDRQRANDWDRFLFKVYITCALIQMGASALYHTVRCVSKWAEDNFLRIDLIGIVIMIIGSYMVAMGQGFTCVRSAFSLYILILMGILGTGCLLSFHPAFQEPKFEAIRHVLLGSGVAFGVIPSLHWLYHCGHECSYVIHTSLLSMFGLYFAGFMIYLGRFPERVSSQGKFDLVGASHQLWHVLVFLASRAWLLGMIDYHAFRRVRAGLPLYVDTLDSHPLYAPQSKLSLPLSFVKKEFHGVEEILRKYGFLANNDPLQNPEPYKDGLHRTEDSLASNTGGGVDLTTPPFVVVGNNVRSNEAYVSFLQAAKEAFSSENADAFYRLDPYEFSILSQSAIKAAIHLTDGYDHLYTDELLACERVLRMDESSTGQFHYLSQKETTSEELIGAWQLFRDNLSAQNETVLFSEEDSEETENEDNTDGFPNDDENAFRVTSVGTVLSIQGIKPSLNKCKALMLDLANGILPFLSKENQVVTANTNTDTSAAAIGSSSGAAGTNGLDGHSLLLLDSDLQLTCDPNGSGREIANFVGRMLNEANKRFFNTHNSLQKFVKSMLQKEEAFQAALEAIEKSDETVKGDPVPLDRSQEEL